VSAFELNNYELANDTIKRFWEEYPVGRIVPVIVDIDLVQGWVLFKVDVYREYADLDPSATGHAYGNVSFYPANMKKWFIEDTETSAIARAIKLLTPSAERPSREDMLKVETLPPVPEAQDFWATKPEESGIPTLGEAIANINDALVGTATVPTPRCTHGARVWKTGEKNGRAWAGYMCQEASRANKCAPLWYEVDNAGKWKVRA
jgi:hypothetical protein